jgi:hypothetical protein
MAYDHDYDHFTQKLNRQHSRESGHGQKVSKSRVPKSKDIVMPDTVGCLCSQSAL